MTLVEGVEIKDHGDGCVTVMGIRVPKLITDNYNKHPSKVNTWCVKLPKYHHTPDGGIKFQTPPVKTPSNYLPTGDPKVFKPNYPACSHLKNDSFVKPSCKCLVVLFNCGKYGGVTSVPRCQTCVKEEKNG